MTLSESYMFALKFAMFLDQPSHYFKGMKHISDNLNVPLSTVELPEPPADQLAILAAGGVALSAYLVRAKVDLS